MLSTHLKTASRSLWKNKASSLINVAGLSIGISAALVIYLIVAYDFSFDKFQKDNDRIFRVVTSITVLGETNHTSGVTYPLPKAIESEVPGVDKVVHFYTIDDDEKTKVSIPKAGSEEPTVFRNQTDLVYADNAYFDLIPYTWLAGSQQTALRNAYQVVLTESNAKKYFPGRTPTEIIGSKITINDSIQSDVVGVVKDLEENTDFSFKTLISKATLETRLISEEEQTTWGGANTASQLFIKLTEGSSAEKVTPLISNLYKKYRKPGRLTFANQLQPLADVHFNNTYTGFVKRLAHKPTLLGLLTVAGFLILLGCINFINLSTAQASQRAREIGIRKTMGSSKRQLIYQFLTETFLLTCLAAVMSIALTPVLLKIFADFVPQGLQFEITPNIIVVLASLVTGVSLLSGIYPAWVLSSLKPVVILKNQVTENTGKAKDLWLRKGFIVSQFVIAQVFIIGTIIVGQQISYTYNKDLGFNKDAIVYLRTNSNDAKESDRFVFMNKLKDVPEIEMVSLASDPPSINSAWMNMLQYNDGKQTIETPVQIKRADTNYLKLFGITLLAGRNLSTSDTTKEFLINETYARHLGFSKPHGALGRQIHWEGKFYPVVGVVANFHQRSLHEPISALVLTTGTDQMHEVNIKLRPQNMQGDTWKTGISKIEKSWNEVYPTSDFEYSFLDDTLRDYYVAEQKISWLLRWAAGLTIFISCLGLLGLVSYIAHRRTREIGIRKVLGASISSIVALFSKDFVKLVTIAIVIATPVALWLINSWLQNFAYRVQIEWWMFVTAGAVTILIAFATISVHAIKSALANPVNSLRSE